MSEAARVRTVAVVNAGSSSIKCSLFDASGAALRETVRADIDLQAGTFVARTVDGRSLAQQRAGEGGGLDHTGAIAMLVRFFGEHVGRDELVAIGHRVVHGGAEHAAPARVDDALLAALDRLVPLAPLHQPHNLAAIRAFAQYLPATPQVACFDTAFHRTIPALAQRFALPEAMYEAGVRRYGFHGLSYEYIASVLPDLDPSAAAGRTIVLHLGNGASMCAMHAGVSVATTMGFTALDGLPMGTRCGAIDPGVLLYLLQARGMSPGDVERLLYRESGLLGVSGISGDMRALLASDAPGARLAVELFVYRIVREIGSLAAALGGLDAIVFTAGIGEHAAPIRARVMQPLRWLGVQPDDAANRAGGPRISTAGSAVHAWVLHTDEELTIARHTLARLREPG